jgi:hypothetical protein
VYVRMCVCVVHTQLQHELGNLANGSTIVYATVMPTNKVQPKGLEHDEQWWLLVRELEPRIQYTKFVLEIVVLAVPPSQWYVLALGLHLELNLQIPHTVRHDTEALFTVWQQKLFDECIKL